jgi:hypothetical protein
LNKNQSWDKEVDNSWFARRANVEAQSAQQNKPNIVFTLTDNVGYGELGVDGVRTQDLGRLQETERADPWRVGKELSPD